MAQQTVGLGDGRERLAGARRHLDQGARPVGGQGVLQARDRLHLRHAQTVGLQQRHRGAQGCPEGGRVRVLVGVPHPRGEGLGTVEGEDLARTGVRVHAVEEVRLRAGGRVPEG